MPREDANIAHNNYTAGADCYTARRDAALETFVDSYDILGSQPVR